MPATAWCRAPLPGLQSRLLFCQTQFACTSTADPCRAQTKNGSICFGGKGQKHVQARHASKTYPTSPPIGQLHSMPVFGRRVTRYMSTCLPRFAFNCFCPTISQPEAVHVVPQTILRKGMINRATAAERAKRNISTQTVNTPSGQTTTFCAPAHKRPHFLLVSTSSMIPPTSAHSSTRQQHHHVQHCCQLPE